MISNVQIVWKSLRNALNFRSILCADVRGLYGVHPTGKCEGGLASWR